MPRVPTAGSIEEAPEKSRPFLEGVQKQMGRVPNIFRTVAQSPAALEGYLAINGALGKGSLPAHMRERIALAIAELNGCGYCLSAHSYFGKLAAKLDDVEIMAARRGEASDPVAQAGLRFAVKIARERGQVTDEDVADVKAAGYTDAQLVEIVQHVAVNTFTNYFNEVFKTEIDFPLAVMRDAA